MNPYLLLAAIIATVIYIKYSKQTKSTQNQKDKIPQSPTYPQADASQQTFGRQHFRDCYQAKYLLTGNELYAYRRLKKYTDEKGLLICPKVRMLDIVEPRYGEKDYKYLLYRVQSKHVDFLICSDDLRIIAIVELDDSSHDSEDRRKRDQMVDEILSDVGYKIIRTRNITEETLQNISNESIT